MSSEAPPTDMPQPPSPDVERAAAFVARFPDAAFVTLRPEGSAHVARVELSVVAGRIRTDGSPGLVRTRHLRRDPRATLFVFGPHPCWLGLETTVTILDGPDAPSSLVALQRARHGDQTPPGKVLAHDDALGHDRLYEVAEFQTHASEKGLFVIDFTILRVYGND